MNNNGEIEKILQKKNFKTFWHCFEFLTTASYVPMEAFNISLKHYGEDKIFDNVAFIINNIDLSIVYYGNRVHNRPQLIIGIVREDNMHLLPMYKTYQKWYYEENICRQQEIETTCEIIEICEITPFIKTYLLNLMIKHYDINISFDKINNLSFSMEDGDVEPIADEGDIGDDIGDIYQQHLNMVRNVERIARMRIER